MTAAIDAIGLVFHRLTVIERDAPYIGPSGAAYSKWLCKCECGKTTSVLIAHLRNGNTRSCGCLLKEGRGRKETHGATSNGAEPKEYAAWASMRQRCRNVTSKNYPRYGGRGISICERWNDFQLFLEDMGTAPSKKHSIDRIDVNGNYEPSNCRWATRFQQANNTRRTRFFVVNGQKKSQSEWAIELGVTSNAIKQRLLRGQTFEHIHAAFRAAKS